MTGKLVDAHCRVKLTISSVTARSMLTWPPSMPAPSQSAFASTMVSFFAGNIIWTILEYTLHRFLFHVDHYLPEANWALLLHFLLHGIHHYLPMDRLRLVMPPTLFLALETPFTNLAHLIFPKAVANGIISGAFTFYILYDCMHYALHHTRLPQYMAEMKRYHLAHHYKSELLHAVFTEVKLTIRLRAGLWSDFKDLGLCLQHCLTYRNQIDVSTTLAFHSFHPSTVPICQL